MAEAVSAALMLLLALPEGDADAVALSVSSEEAVPPEDVAEAVSVSSWAWR